MRGYHFRGHHNKEGLGNYHMSMTFMTLPLVLQVPMGSVVNISLVQS